MKKVKRRTVATLLIASLLLLGLGAYFARYLAHGDAWASFVSNKNVYQNGILNVGTVLDRNGIILSTVTDGNRTYSADKSVRMATLHAVGDSSGNIGTGALSAFASKLIGYNFLFGTYSLNNKGTDLYLTIDSELNVVAYEALNGRKGSVAVFNYETGEIICMVSSPTYDPANPPDSTDDDSKYEGVYINRFLSSTYTPGSIFKIVTTAAAIENIDDLYERTYTCDGSYEIGGDTVTCPKAHGTLTIEDALAVSCNCTFAQIAMELGGDTLSEYADQFGLTDTFSVNGMTTAAGNFAIAEEGTAELAWSGIGQYNDTVNPLAMLRLLGAIANDGIAVDPTLMMKSGISVITQKGSSRLLEQNTAEALQSMLSYNVFKTYGINSFPGLELHAKSGTAEVGGDMSPHAWFVGYITNEDYPLAFVVIVENGGGGSSTAGKIANTVLQAAMER